MLGDFSSGEKKKNKDRKDSETMVRVIFCMIRKKIIKAFLALRLCKKIGGECANEYAFQKDALLPQLEVWRHFTYHRSCNRFFLSLFFLFWVYWHLKAENSRRQLESCEVCDFKIYFNWVVLLRINSRFLNRILEASLLSSHVLPKLCTTRFVHLTEARTITMQNNFKSFFFILSTFFDYFFSLLHFMNN